MNRTNSVIKFDLHIHSKKSDYKESDGIVDNSTKENLSVLFQKLNENNVALFSITDHNRFDADLYKAICEKIKNEHDIYPNVLNVVAGVEFDVKLDEDMEKCHIITIFDAKNNSDYDKIERIINENKLERKEDYYNKERFEQLLKDIKLNTILIVHQKKELSNHDGKNASLSDACSDADEIIRMGYIDALEIQNSRVEGILLNNLKELNLPCPLFSGSDCHDWTVYPAHDSSKSDHEFHHSEAKILPTFKGLLMAITSPETRFNRGYEVGEPVKLIKINDNEIPLVNGINAIIGENGSGKTTLLEAISGNKNNPRHIKELIIKNKITCENGIRDISKKYITQGEIIKSFYSKTLFEEANNYNDVNNEKFIKTYAEYKDVLYKCISSSINKHKLINSLFDKSIEFDSINAPNNYYIEIIDDIEKDPVETDLRNTYKKFQNINDDIENILKDKILKEYEEQITNAFAILKNVLEIIKVKLRNIESKNQVLNIISARVADYKQKVQTFQDSVTTKNQLYKTKLNNFIQDIVNAIRNKNIEIKWPENPPIICGYNRNKKYGYNFNSETNYSQKDVYPYFLETMFTSDYRNIDEIKKIASYEDFQKAVWNCSKIDDISNKWENNYDKFIEKMVECDHYISEENGDSKIGNTLGEMSLVYYKFCTSDVSSWNLLMVDQPEDNISNNNIKDKLISYFNFIRNNNNNKQIIFVTHNPLLVVNLDVDNVIFLKNMNGNIEASSGCLEFEDSTINILDTIAENMDGGKDTIERRLKVYGKNY